MLSVDWKRNFWDSKGKGKNKKSTETNKIFFKEINSTWDYRKRDSYEEKDETRICTWDKKEWKLIQSTVGSTREFQKRRVGSVWEDLKVVHPLSKFILYISDLFMSYGL